MTTDACATPGCGHAKNEHWDGRLQCFDGLIGHCTAYLPPRPVPEVWRHCRWFEPSHDADPLPNTFYIQRGTGNTEAKCSGCGEAIVRQPPATVPAPHADAEAAEPDAIDVAYKRGWLDSAVHHATCNECGKGPLRHEIPTAPAHLRGRGDRG